ncbi:MAG: metallophosphoesterase family protein [Acidobacteriota bacterium]
MSEELLIVGDVHGDNDRLQRMLDITHRFDRRVIFLGDYINRGLDSSAVLESLSQLKQQAPDRYTFLCGNHELALLKYLADRSFAPFAAIGGLRTIRSYVRSDISGDVYRAFCRSVPSHHRLFLESLEAYWETDTILVSHAGYDPQKPDDRSIESVAMRSHPLIFQEATSPKPRIVCGHYVQSSGRPFVGKNLVCVDTGCGTIGGPLTAVLLPELEFISA